jgi:hypothetical protein
MRIETQNQQWTRPAGAPRFFVLSYMAAVLDALRAEGYAVGEEVIQQLSAARHTHIRSVQVGWHPGSACEPKPATVSVAQSHKAMFTAGYSCSRR